MPRYICKLDGMYFDWSTIVDAPVTYGMSLEEYKEYYKAEYGNLSFENELPERLKRVEEKGTSSFDYLNINDLISYNRAGPKESSLDIDGIINLLREK